MAIAPVGFHLRIGEARIVEKQVDIIDQLQNGFVELAIFMFGVGNDCETTTLPVDAVTDGIAGMVQHAGGNVEIGVDGEHVPSLEILGDDLGAANVERSGGTTVGS